MAVLDHPPTRTDPDAHPDAFRHPALFYRGDHDYLAGTVPFVTAAVAAGDPVAVAVPEPNLSLLRDALSTELGAAAEAVELLDMAEAGRNPGRIIPGVLRAFADRHAADGRRVRIIGEPIWADRSSAEYPACVQHEALINYAFAGRRVSILCPYDAGALTPQALADAEATHPELRDAGGPRANTGYAPQRILAAYNMALPPPAVDAQPVTELRFGHGIQPVRRLVRRCAQAAGLAARRVLDVELAVNELAGNSVAHAGGGGLLRIWAEDGYLVCETQDCGHITDPLVGRRPVDPAVPGGRGLLLVHRLADLVRMHALRGDTTIRAYFRR